MPVLVRSVWVELGLPNTIILQKVSQFDLEMSRFQLTFCQFYIFHETPVVISKQYVRLFSTSDGPFSNLLPHIARELTVLDCVAKEHHISWFDD